MKLIEEIRNNDGSHNGWAFYCPGCNWPHILDNRWSFNGDLEHPTFEPSLGIAMNEPDRKCHLYLRNGQIEYQHDCHHAFAGKTIPMEEFSWGGKG
jgi:hypothetical protein